MGQIFPTASLHRDHSILYALVCEKECSHMRRNINSMLVTVKTLYNVIRYNRKFNIRHRNAGNGSVSINIPSL